LLDFYDLERFLDFRDTLSFLGVLLRGDLTVEVLSSLTALRFISSLASFNDFKEGLEVEGSTAPNILY